MIKRFRWWLFSKLVGPIIAICPQPQRSYFRRTLGYGAIAVVEELAAKGMLPPEITSGSGNVRFGSCAEEDFDG